MATITFQFETEDQGLIIEALRLAAEHEDRTATLCERPRRGRKADTEATTRAHRAKARAVQYRRLFGYMLDRASQF